MNFSTGLMSATSVADVGDVVERDPTGRYVRSDEFLGKGASKTVYKAFDEVDGIEVAWNQMNVEDVLQSPEQLQRLYSEIHMLKSLKHDNVMKFYHSWVDFKNKTINMITELFSAGSLRQYRKKHKKVSIQAIKNWARQILQGLHYLHSHDPPVVHRDLKCDNIFVNGNNGVVKIGDLGLATFMQQHVARSVVGTPEFMAPELYDEEYNELVDIYSFGMCILEMVTCEYPYSECKNPAQIYKKVTSGIKPASLDKVTDFQVKRFIEKCIVPATMRVSAIELLKDPFLAVASGNSKEVLFDPIRLPSSSLKPVEPQQPELQHMDKNTDCERVSMGCSAKCKDETSPLAMQEFKRFTENNVFRMEGVEIDNNTNTVSLTLCITGSSGVKSIHFPYDLDLDTASSIASEMVEELDLPKEEAIVIAELIDDSIMKLVHASEPSCGSHPCGTSSSSETYAESRNGGILSQYPSDSELVQIPAVVAANRQLANVEPHDTKQEPHNTKQSMFSDVTLEYGHTIASDAGSLKALEYDYGRDGFWKGLDRCTLQSDIESSAPCKHKEKVYEGIHGECGRTDYSIKHSEIFLCSDLSKFTTLLETDQHDKLKLEFVAIDLHYFGEVLKTREGMESAKKRWISKKKVCAF